MKILRSLEVYMLLLDHARKITHNLDSIKKYLFYSTFINQNDEWSGHIYKKFLQKGDDLGERMLNAFKLTLKDTNKAILIVTDCYELDSKIIKNAFNELSKNDVVIGPDTDGGYYLIGMNNLYPKLFQNKKWSTETVCSDTIQDIEDLNLTYVKLKHLSDVDTYEDLMKSDLFKILNK
ncbi:MAG: TIGR04282 family arsenosugar biosynthesis glycosyltransferase [Candidatus Lokiarchaeota archaeon]